MGFFELKSRITIGSLQFSGVHEVRIERSVKHVNDYALIKVPSIGMIKKGDGAGLGSVNVISLGTLWQPGDKVKIELGYATPYDAPGADIYKEEFRGFVRNCNLNMPLEVECEGYGRLLRLNSIKKNYPSINVKDLLEEICKGTDIKVVCPVDFPLKGLRIPNNNGVEVINHIKKCSCGALTIFFIEPDVLWCGLVNTQFLAGKNPFDAAHGGKTPTAGYQLGWNVVKDNGLKIRTPKEHVQVIVNGKLANAAQVMTESKDKTAARRVQFLQNNVGSDAALKDFAQEVADNMNYTGYEGTINGFLQPYCLPGYVAHVVDSRYGKQDGDYLVESTKVTFGVNGARRVCGIGVKLSR